MTNRRDFIKDTALATVACVAMPYYPGKNAKNVTAKDISDLNPHHLDFINNLYEYINFKQYSDKEIFPELIENDFIDQEYYDLNYDYAKNENWEDDIERWRNPDYAFYRASSHHLIRSCDLSRLRNDYVIVPGFIIAVTQKDHDYKKAYEKILDYTKIEIDACIKSACITNPERLSKEEMTPYSGKLAIMQKFKPYDIVFPPSKTSALEDGIQSPSLKLIPNNKSNIYAIKIGLVIF